MYSELVTYRKVLNSKVSTRMLDIGIVKCLSHRRLLFVSIMLSTQ